MTSGARTTSSSRVGLCIAGCGGFAHEHARRAAGLGDRIDLHFASRSLEKAQQYADWYAAAGAFGSYADAANDRRVDAMLFCTPHSLHREHLELAAAAGKHVLMEKPIAARMEDAQAMIRAARSAGILFMVAENYLYHPLVASATELVRQGAIGRVRAVHILSTRYRPSDDWRNSWAINGGGALIDGGIHMIAAMRALAGDVERVSAAAHPKFSPGMEGEEAISLQAWFSSGAVGTLTYSWSDAGESHTAVCLVQGEEGNLRFTLDRGSAVEVTSAAGRRAVPVQGDVQGLRQQLEAFLDFMDTGIAPQASAESGAADLAVVLAGYASVEQGGRLVNVEPS